MGFFGQNTSCPQNDLLTGVGIMLPVIYLELQHFSSAGIDSVSKVGRRGICQTLYRLPPHPNPLPFLGEGTIIIFAKSCHPEVLRT